MATVRYDGRDYDVLDTLSVTMDEKDVTVPVVPFRDRPAERILYEYAADEADVDQRTLWEQLRLQGLGGSDIGTVCGHNPFASRYALYQKKKKQLTIDISDEFPVRVGNTLEPLLRQRFENRHNVTVEDDEVLLRHPDHPWAFGTPDGQIHDNHAIFEAKAAGYFFRRNEFGADGSQRVPLTYYYQVQWYLGIIGYDRATIMVGFVDYDSIDDPEDPEDVLLATRRICEYPFERNDRVIEELQRRGEQFVKDLRAGNEPNVDGSDATKDVLRVLYPRERSGHLKSGNDRIDELVEKLHEVEYKLDELNEEKDAIKNELRAYIGEDRGVQTKYGPVTWKSETTTYIDSESLRTERPDVAKRHESTTEKRVLRTPDREDDHA